METSRSSSDPDPISVNLMRTICTYKLCFSCEIFSTRALIWVENGHLNSVSTLTGCLIRCANFEAIPASIHSPPLDLSQMSAMASRQSPWLMAFLAFLGLPAKTFQLSWLHVLSHSLSLCSLAE
ncbi:hypothetical protein FGO68_gene1569 [Halteria grandinella]|uniref:Uncharacterized protein n=1 Tax=Halteria grandinella TaxID=5974 RepID=A0A8J8SU59_HALGN|nr:hypothetical protein FGO68_gene1569 [Halteria grandinella]